MIVFWLTYAYVLLTYEGRDWLVFNKLRFDVQNLQYNSNYNPNIEWLFYDGFDVQIVDKLFSKYIPFNHYYSNSKMMFNHTAVKKYHKVTLYNLPN